MKLRDSYSGEAADSALRKRRLQMLLAAWRFPRFAYWAERGVPPPDTTLNTEELVLWFEILRVARPVPPRTHLPGLETCARLRDVRIDDLVGEQSVLVLDDRVALRSKVPQLGLLGRRWSLLVPAQISGQVTEPVLRKRFREMEVHDDEVIAWGSWFNCTDSIAALVREALIADSAAALVRTWQVSLALDLEYRFLPSLPAVPARALADLLGKELIGAAVRLSVETDMRLLQFAFGRSNGLPVINSMHLPDSRLSRLLEVDRFFEHAHHHLNDGYWYYDAVASAFARIAEDLALATVLQKLAPGSALIAALDAVWLDRPELVAAYTSNPTFHAEGAFTLIRLPQQAHLAQANQLDLGEEWLQAQQLGRQLLLLGDTSEDWPSVIALGVHDESLTIGRRHHVQAPIERMRAHLDDAPALWAAAVADSESAMPIIDHLVMHLRTRTPHHDSTLVFALRLLHPLRESGQPALAARLATAIADAYIAGLSLDIKILVIPEVLGTYGGLLADLREALVTDTATWRKFLRPFDPVRYLEIANADRLENRSSAQVNPSFDVPRLVRAHAETLIALASAVDAFEEPLQAALELCDADREANLPVGAFSWMGLARISSLAGASVGAPLFEAIGRLFSRVVGSPPWLEAFVRNESEAHLLASLVAGLGVSHPLAETIRPKLREALNALLADEHGMALGHALELANTLQRAEMPRDAERFARRALEVVEAVPGRLDSYDTAARALLAGALAQQGLWPELLAFEQPRDAIILSPQARFIENMRALALMESGKLSEAEDVLEGVLAADAGDRAALVNRTFLYLRAKNWTKAIAAAADAKPRLSGDDLDRLLLNEANAREQLGDAFSAANLLDAVSGRAKGRADVIEARERLRCGERGVASAVPLEVRTATEPTSAPIEPREVETQGQLRALPLPADVVDVAIVTALEEEYTAVRECLTAWRAVAADGSQYPNVYGWVTGTIPRGDGTGTYRVVLAWAGASGNVRTAITTLRTIDRWQPRYVLFCGIAGGLPKEAFARATSCCRSRFGTTSTARSIGGSSSRAIGIRFGSIRDFSAPRVHSTAPTLRGSAAA